MREFHRTPLPLDLAGLVPDDDRDALLALPDETDVRGKRIRIEYDLEETPPSADASGDGNSAAKPHVAVARLVLPEKLARSLVEDELPVLDRPLRFAVHRGARGAARAASLGELQDVLDRPWSPEEPRPARRERESGRTAREARRGARDMRHAERELRKGRDGGDRRGRPGRGGGKRGGGRRG
jgi:hypothetical protein